VGRRGGKSRAAAVIAVYIAALCDHSDKIVVGERPVVLCIAQNQKQANVVFSYVAGIFESTPALVSMIANQTADSITLTNGVVIEVRAASFRGLRGVTALAVIADESCFWRTDEGSANGDSEIITAILPALATTGGPLILISSPYSRRGRTWEIYKRHFGPQGDPLILVAQGASRDFNPGLPQRVVDRALEADPAAAAAEHLGQWRTDLEAFVSIDLVAALVDRGVFERQPLGDVKYSAFVDPSGGSADSFTLAITHREGDLVILDAMRERKPPFSPDAVVVEFAELLKTYHVGHVVGDRYGGEFPRELFRKSGIEYVCADKTKSEFYGELLPLLNSGRVALLDNQRLVAQLCSLERRTTRVGRDSIDHPQGGHDDLINAGAGAMVLASRVQPPMRFHPPTAGLRRSEVMAANFGALHGAAESAPPGGWPVGSPHAAAWTGHWTPNRGPRE
jgi:hypothetical protein